MQPDPIKNQGLLDSKYRTTAIVFGAQIMSALVLVAVAFVAAPRIASPAGDENNFSTLWIGVLFVAVGSFLLRRTFMNWERLRDVAILKGIGGVLATLQRNSIILGAVGEAVAVLGFVIAVMSGNPFDTVRAGLIALVVFGVNFPRKNVWRTIVASLEQVKEVT